MQDKRSFIIDKAPGKELIQIIIETKSLASLHEFFDLRLNWHDSSPLVHDRLITYGIFTDLEIAIKRAKGFSPVLIDHAITLAKGQTERQFLCAIFLFAGFCSLGKNEFNPTSKQIAELPELLEKVKKYSSLPNLSCFWEQALDYFEKEGSFNREAFTV
ncbi:MAG TPA: hypothetical protein PLB11_16700 [Flavobacterium sp.]|nr:hypothetical protein [Flavobacterium sp.]